MKSKIIGIEMNIINTMNISSTSLGELIFVTVDIEMLIASLVVSADNYFVSC